MNNNCILIIIHIIFQHNNVLVNLIYIYIYYTIMCILTGEIENNNLK